MANLLCLQCSLSLKLNGIILRFALVPSKRKSKTEEKNIPRLYGNTKIYYTYIYFSVCFFALTYIWDSETCPQRRPSFSLPSPNTLWGRRDMNFYTEGIDSEHTWRGQTQICSILCHTLRDCGLQGFPSHPFPLHRSSLVRFCSQSKPTAYSEIKIIINFSFTLVPLRWGFGLVNTSKTKAVTCVALKLLQKHHQ